MKHLFSGALLAGLLISLAVPVMAEVDVRVNISLPPRIVFNAPPEVIVIPDTHDVYAVPDLVEDIFFWNGLWWRLWEGRWYKSYHYDRDWARYGGVPKFYFDVDPEWRGHFKKRVWRGHAWKYERIPHQRLQQNWKTWYDGRNWEKVRVWDVDGYTPGHEDERYKLRNQREKQYHQREEARRQQLKLQEQKKRQLQERKEQKQQLQRQKRQAQAEKKLRQQERKEQKQQLQRQKQQGPANPSHGRQEERGRSGEKHEGRGDGPGRK